MVTLTWCDWHLTEKDEEVPATAMPEFEGMGLDLCEPCAGQVAAMRAFYELYGSKGSRTMRVPRSKLQVAAAGAMVEKRGQVLCPSPGCGKTYKNRGSLGAHVRQDHATTLPLLEGKPATEVCETCGQKFASKQAIGMHQRKHTREKARKPARKAS